VINLWPSIINKAAALKEKCLKGIGNVLTVEKKLQNFPLNPLQTDQFIVGIAGEKEDKTASNK
jgi:hypothetical protein